MEYCYSHSRGCLCPGLALMAIVFLSTSIQGERIPHFSAAYSSNRSPHSRKPVDALPDSPSSTGSSFPCHDADDVMECVWTQMSHHIHASERRITSKFDSKMRRFNQTMTILHLEKLFHFVNEELQITKEITREKDKVILQLQRTVAQQERHVQVLAGNVQQLTRMVEDISSTIGQNKVTSKVTAEVTTRSPATTTERQIPDFQPLFPADCQSVYKEGDMKDPGFYYILVQPYSSPKPFQACCRMLNHSGWTLIQRRQDGSVDFFRTWKEYKQGFGNLEGEFWLGNDKIHQLTAQGDYRLRIEMTDWEGKSHWAEYDHFSISDETDMYRLHVSGYHGNAGDSMTSHWENHDNQPFSTKDVDNDQRFYDNCANHYRGAWWFKNCFESHLNGVYYQQGEHNNFFVRNGIQWNTIHLHSSLRHVEMMVKPNPDSKREIPNQLD